MHAIGVMICTFGDDMQPLADGMHAVGVVIYQAFGLDKKRQVKTASHKDIK